MTKPNPENCNNCSSKCAYDCAQLSCTIQHRTVLIISPLTPRQTPWLRCCQLSSSLYSFEINTGRPGQRWTLEVLISHRTVPCRAVKELLPERGEGRLAWVQKTMAVRGGRHLTNTIERSVPRDDTGYLCRYCNNLFSSQPVR